jgi:hypothetical protein
MTDRVVSPWLVDFEKFWKYILIVCKYISRPFFKFFYFLLFIFLKNYLWTSLFNKIKNFRKILIFRWTTWKVMFWEICSGKSKLRNKKIKNNLEIYLLTSKIYFQTSSKSTNHVLTTRSVICHFFEIFDIFLNSWNSNFRNDPEKNFLIVKEFKYIWSN